MITITTKGDFKKSWKSLEKLSTIPMGVLFAYYGQMGVKALEDASPVDTGLMASSWRYTVEKRKYGYSITWHNDDIENGYNVAVLVQYGHGLQNGVYVEGVDYINPAMEKVLESFVKRIWEEIERS